jgi:polyhydroxyalkanoate synthesis regulator phasin
MSVLIKEKEHRLSGRRKILHKFMRSKRAGVLELEIVERKDVEEARTRTVRQLVAGRETGREARVGCLREVIGELEERVQEMDEEDARRGSGMIVPLAL